MGAYSAVKPIIRDIEKMHATNPCYGKTYHACTNMDTAGCAQFASGAKVMQCMNHMNGCIGMTFSFSFLFIV